MHTALAIIVARRRISFCDIGGCNDGVCCSFSFLLFGDLSKNDTFAQRRRQLKKVGNVPFRDKFYRQNPVVNIDYRNTNFEICRAGNKICNELFLFVMILLPGYPSVTSRIIINRKPPMTLRVPLLECSPRCASGISSSTTTYIMEPAAKLRSQGING